jgi:hypothetical protein
MSTGVKATVRFVTDDLFSASLPPVTLWLDTDKAKIVSAFSRGAAARRAWLVHGDGRGISILTKKRQHVTSYVVEVTGERRDEYPRRYTTMKVHHILTGKSISPKAVAHAIELSETKYCSVAATLRPAVEIQTSFEIIEESPESTRE